jgi:signal transduction histidine kinase
VHRLLERQIKRFLGDSATLSPELAAFVAAVGEAYQSADADRLMIERSLDLMSKELIETNSGLRNELADRKLADEALSKEKDEQRILIKKLEEAHNQLLQSEKMASIGQLAAGVAHEINNPIGYVNSNLGTLRSYVEKILSVLDAYEQAEAVCNPVARARARALKEEVELDFLKEDILSLLKESGEGIQRVKQIVQDLKDFSHVDEAEWQLADLHSGLDSTLNVVNNEIKYKADVVREYGDIPRVECLPSQINQVFMNMLVNAAHAMDDDKRGLITVRTGADGDEVWVEFADNGKGIPPENLTRIFDPFFTTKPIGKGTGLGLSLSYSIVEKHHGRIEVISEVGKGTIFRVILPVTNVGLEAKG